MHIFGKDYTETEARVRVELSGWSPGAKDRVLWAICKSRLNPTKLRRHRPNIQLFPQTLNVERPRCPCLPTPRIRSGLRLYSVFFTEGKLGEDENSFAWGVWLAFSTLTYETWWVIDGYGICFTVAQGSVTLLASGDSVIDYIILSKFRISRGYDVMHWL